MVAAAKREGCGRSSCATWHNKPCLVCTHPDLVKEWDLKRNERGPSTVSGGSDYKAHWVCAKGHRWQVRVANRALRGDQCNACLGRRSTVENNLTTTNPELVKEWDHERNDKDPTELVAGSLYKAHWVCENGHQWQSLVHLRALHGFGCKRCSGKEATPENNFTVTHPELVKEWDYERNDRNPSEILKGSSYRAYWVCSKGHRWRTTVTNRTSRGDGCKACLGRKATPESNFATTYPDLLKEWDYERNEKDPSNLVARSGYKAYWVCHAGHRWRTTIYDRTSGSYSCPACGYGQKFLFIIPGLLYTLGIPDTVPPEAEVIAEARHQGVPDHYMNPLLDAIRLLKTGTFTPEDFRRYTDGEPSPLAEFLTGSEAHRRAVKEGWVSVSR